jgi:F-type H+-transporting ATPase subunit c
MTRRRSSWFCIKSRAEYPNGPLENYQQKFHILSGGDLPCGANDFHPVVTFHLSFKRKKILNGMFNGPALKHEAAFGHDKIIPIPVTICVIFLSGKRMAHLLQNPRSNQEALSPDAPLCYGDGEISFIDERGKTMLRKFGKGLLTLGFSSAVLLFSSPLAFAAEALPAGGESYTKVLFAVGAMIAAGFAIGVGAVGAGLGIGTAASGACSAVGRNPGVQGKIMMTMLVGMAMAESIAIYALVVSLVLLYANPYMKYFLAG